MLSLSKHLAPIKTSSTGLGGQKCKKIVAYSRTAIPDEHFHSFSKYYDIRLKKLNQRNHYLSSSVNS